MVLALLSVLIVLVVHLLSESRSAGSLAAARLERERLTAAAGDAVHRAMQRLADDEDPFVDHPDEPWAKEEILLDPSGLAVRTRIEDEGRRFDINNLGMEPGIERRRPPEDILTDIFLAFGDPSPGPRVEALRDWIDEDNDGRFEAPAYADLKPPVLPSNLPLESWSEWAFIQGFSRPWFNDPSMGESEPGERPLPADLLTMLPTRPTRTSSVNLNTAPESLLALLFGRGQDYLARAVITLREAAPLRSTDGITVLADPLRMARLLPYLDLKSEWFRIESLATGRRASARVTALVRRESDGTVHAVRWTYL